VCNATFSEKGGRATTQAPGAPNPYVDWTETTQGNGSPTTNYQPCQVAMGHYTALLAPANPADGAGGYYSNDAMLLSNSFPGGTGPTFDQPVTTGWRFDASAGGMCGTASGQNYRSFELTCAGYPINVGGSPNPNSKYPTVQYVSQGPAIPAGTPSIPTDGCVYNGPTRVVLNGDGTATVTSPQTTTAWISANAAARPPQCYPGAGASGMALQVVNLTSPVAIHVLEAANNGGSPTTPAVAHGSSGWNTTGQRVGDAPSTANSVFYMASGTAGSATGSTTTTVSATDAGYAPSTGTSPATGQDGAWTPQWTAYSTGTSCSTATPGTDLKFFNCKYPAGSYSDSYRALRAAVRAELAANGATYSSATALQSYLTKLLAPYNSADAANATPSNPDNTSFRWTASVVQDTGATDGCTPGAAQSTPTGSTPIAPPTSDHLFASTPGSTATTTSTNTVCLTAVITLQVGQSSGSKTAWSSPIPQLKFTETYGKATPTTTVTPAVSSFPDMADVTQYQMGDGGTFGSDGPGDLYVEGRSTQTLTLLADDDLVVTGSIRPTDATQGVVELVGRNNVRIFHPVSCVQPTDVSAANWAAAITATQPGFCPDDITGLYTGTVAARNRPDQQYANMAANPASLQIVGPVFALGNADLKMTCPQPPGGGGVCGGEFTVDNYNRGTGLGGDKSNPLVIGTVAMAHHAPVGEEWEIPDTNGQTSRPWSGYQLIIQYRNFKNVLDASAENKNLLHTIVTTSSMWHVVSASLGRWTS
jgi:hypothetical protein